MKKTIFILTLLFALAATPAIANQGKGKPNEHANDRATKNQQVQSLDITPSVSPSVSPTEEENEDENEEEKCGPNEEYKNHGAYVSCVAKTHPDGKEVSEAAKFDIGKKHVEDEDDITPSPSVSPSVSPTVTPSVSPTIDPSPSASPSPTITEADENTQVLSQQIKELIETLKEFIQNLKNLATL